VGARSVVLLVVLLCALAVTTAAAPADDSPPVTMIGDSIATGMQWHDDAIAILQQNLGIDWEVAVCRRLVAPSCPFDGGQAPTLVNLVHSLGPKLAPLVVVEMGYNELEKSFAASVETSIQTLLAAGVKRIIWLNLRESRHPYVRMNATLGAAAARHPQVALVDWNRYSRSHSEWFQNDGEHLLDPGGVAMATQIHAAIEDALRPPVASSAHLRAHVGHPFNGKLVVRGGVAPYRWRIAAGKLPRGLELMAGGKVVGTPTLKTAAQVTVWATDAYGMTTICRELVSVA
jgi:Putative Ig domain